MARQKTNLAFVYLVTILITFVLVGGTAFFIYNKYVFPKPVETTENLSSAYLPFTPDEDQNQTILFILEGGDTVTDDVFLLTRFLPTEEKLIVVPLSGETFSQINTEKSTIYEFYRTGGALQAVKAVENAVNITVDRYMKFDKEAFNTLVDIFGGVNFDVPYDLIYDNTATGEAVVLKEGLQPLDGIRLRWLFTFPSLEGGEEYRVKIIGSAVCDMINQSLSEHLADSIDSSFNAIINSVDTNITAYDFNFRKAAIAYMIEPGKTPAQFKTPVGEYNDEKQFVLGKKFKEDILYWFKVEPIIET